MISGQRTLYNFMQTDYYRTNAAITRMNANIQHARVCLAEVIHRVFIENANHFIQPNF